MWVYLIIAAILFAATADLLFSFALPLIVVLPLKLLFYLLNTFVFKKTEKRNQEKIRLALEERDRTIKEEKSFTITIEPKS